MEDRYVFLFEEVQVMAKGNDSKYRNVQKCRDDLLEFLDVNEWFGMSKRGADKNIEVIITDKALSSLELWINAYGRPADSASVRFLKAAVRFLIPRRGISPASRLRRTGVWDVSAKSRGILE